VAEEELVWREESRAGLNGGWSIVSGQIEIIRKAFSTAKSRISSADTRRRNNWKTRKIPRFLGVVSRHLIRRGGIPVEKPALYTLLIFAINTFLFNEMRSFCLPRG
jgi:hypothetical protein